MLKAYLLTIYPPLVYLGTSDIYPLFIAENTKIMKIYKMANLIYSFWLTSATLKSYNGSFLVSVTLELYIKIVTSVYKIRYKTYTIKNI